jgi:hypothetical protein
MWNSTAEQVEGPPNPAEMGAPDLARAGYDVSQRPYRVLSEHVWGARGRATSKWCATRRLRQRSPPAHVREVTRSRALEIRRQKYPQSQSTMLCRTTSLIVRR